MVTLTFDLLTLKAVSESRVTWATSVPILVFLDLSVLDLGPMYTTDSVRCQTKASLNASPIRVGHNKDEHNVVGGQKIVKRGSHPAGTYSLFGYLGEL